MSNMPVFNAIMTVYLVADKYNISQPRPDKYHSWDAAGNTRL